MTLTIDETETTQHAASPEQRMFRAVITEAVMDAIGKSRVSESTGPRDLARRQALSWFHDAGRDFQAVCELADLDPARTRSAVIDFLARDHTSLRRPTTHQRSRSSKPGLRDVAAQSGCAIGTIRRFIVGDPTVSPDKRQRITRAIHETGYVHIPRKRAA